MDGADEQLPDDAAPAPRSWSDLVSALHGGIAIISDDCRLAFVSDRFVELTGIAAPQPIGMSVDDVFPDVVDPRGVLDEIRAGNVIEFEHRWRSDRDELHSARIHVMPCDQLHEPLLAVIFVLDTSETHRILARQRQTTLQLTRIENDYHQRIDRELRDGHLRTLADLARRLEPTSVPLNLKQMVVRVSAEYDAALTELAPARAPDNAAVKLEHWIEPFLGGIIDMTIVDDLAELPSEADLQSLFILIYELVRASRFIGRPRVHHASVIDERGGYLLTATTSDATGENIGLGRTATQFRAIIQYVHTLGGTLSTWIEDRVRYYTVWLPRLAEPDADGVRVPLHTETGAPFDPANWLAPNPELPDETWAEIARIAPEPLAEITKNFEFVFVNRAYTEMEGASETEILSGSSPSSVFTTHNVMQFAGHVPDLNAGRPVRLEWERPSADGVLRTVAVHANPVRGPDGETSGVHAAIEDRSDLHALEHLHGSALADLRKAQRRELRRFASRMQQPMMLMNDVIERLRDEELSASAPGEIREMRIELQDGARRFQEALDALSRDDSPADVTSG